jgi:hypothetical protein
MITLGMLWLPILVSAVIVFIASNILWMVLPFWHHKDYSQLATGTSDALAANLKDTPSGQYMIPNMNWGKMTDEQKAAVQKGPGGLLLLRNPMQFSMGTALGGYFLFNIVVIAIIAYVGTFSLGVGAKYPQVFRVIASAGILGYSFHTVSDSIWYGRPWSSTIKFIIDGLIYGLLIGGTFGWLWPR